MMEEMFQLTQCEDVQPIHERDKDVSEIVVQVSSAKENLDLCVILMQKKLNCDCNAGPKLVFSVGKVIFAPNVLF